MTFKQRFKKQHKKFQSKSKQFSLDKIKNQSPIGFSADAMMQQSGIRCDYFVLCDCNPSTTGIYVIEVKSGTAEINDVKKQLQSGADFMSNQLSKSDQFEFLPIIVAKGMPSSLRSSKNKNNSIHLQGKTRYIKHIKVGGPLEKITL